MKLGIQLNNWRFKKDTLSLHVVRALNERAFAWDIFEEDFRTIVIALKTFGELKGNLLVPHSFQVPATSQWPTSTHGYHLGRAVHSLRVTKGLILQRTKYWKPWDLFGFLFNMDLKQGC